MRRHAPRFHRSAFSRSRPTALAGPRAPVPAKPAAVTATTFVVSGRGWGHGVGDEPVRGDGLCATTAGRTTRSSPTSTSAPSSGQRPSRQVRVLVGEAKGAVKLRSRVPFRVRDVFGKTYPLPAGRARARAEAVGDRERRADRARRADPLPSRHRAAPRLDRPYRGQIEVGVTGQKLNAVNVVGLEQYLQGVVPQEMPSAWPDEALKAQAVAARSYALSHRVSGKNFDLYADVRSQVYGGIAAESARTTAAVQATTGEVLPLGREADRRALPLDLGREDGGGGRGLRKGRVPYLVSVDDPHSDLSPLNRWGPIAVPETTVRKGLKLRTPVTDPQARTRRLRPRAERRTSRRRPEPRR